MLLYCWQLFRIRPVDFTLSKQINHTNIPSTFYSQASEALFTRCICCDESLLETGQEYVIEKAYRRYPQYELDDTVFEYAMCLDCLIQLQNQMSESSLQRIEAYFNSKVDFNARYYEPQESVDILSRLSNCMITGTPLEELSEYQIFGLFRYDSMLLGPFPYMIGGDAMDEIATLLSNKTLGEIDGFMDEHFGLPPELRKLFLDNPVMLI